MNIKRIALFAIGWFLLQGALGLAAGYAFFEYRGDELRANPAMAGDAFAQFFFITDSFLIVATLAVYLLFLRALQARLILHVLALFLSLETLQFLYAAITGGLGEIFEWLPVVGKDLAIALLAVAVISSVRRYKARTALRQTSTEPPKAE